MPEKIPISLYNSDLFLKEEFARLNQEILDLENAQKSLFVKPVLSYTMQGFGFARNEVTGTQLSADAENNQRKLEAQQNSAQRPSTYSLLPVQIQSLSPLQARLGKGSRRKISSRGKGFGNVKKGDFTLTENIFWQNQKCVPTGKIDAPKEKLSKEKERGVSYIGLINSFFKIDFCFSYSRMLSNTLNKRIRSGVSREFLFVTTNLILFGILAIIQRNNYGKTSIFTSDKQLRYDSPPIANIFGGYDQSETSLAKLLSHRTKSTSSSQLVQKDYKASQSSLYKDKAKLCKASNETKLCQSFFVKKPENCCKLEHKDTKLSGLQYYLPFYVGKKRIFTENDTIPSKRGTIYYNLVGGVPLFQQTPVRARCLKEETVTVSQAVLKRCFYKYGVLFVCFAKPAPSKNVVLPPSVRTRLGYVSKTLQSEALFKFLQCPLPELCSDKIQLEKKLRCNNFCLRCSLAFVQVFDYFSQSIPRFLQSKALYGFRLHGNSFATHQSQGSQKTPFFYRDEGFDMLAKQSSVGEDLRPKSSRHTKPSFVKRLEEVSFGVALHTSTKQFETPTPVEGSQAQHKIEEHKAYKSKLLFKLCKKEGTFCNPLSFWHIRDLIPTFTFIPDNRVVNTCVSGYQFPELEKREITSLFRKKALFNFYLARRHFTNHSTLKAKRVQAPYKAKLWIAKERYPNALQSEALYGLQTPYNGVCTNFLEAQQSLALEASCNRLLSKPSFACESLHVVHTKLDKDSTKLVFTKPSFVQVRAPEKTMHTHFSFSEGVNLKMQYTQVNLDEISQCKALFQKMGRDYEDYLRQPKDSLPALIISPSLEDDREIEEEGIRIFSKRDFIKNQGLKDGSSMSRQTSSAVPQGIAFDEGSTSREARVQTKEVLQPSEFRSLQSGNFANNFAQIPTEVKIDNTSFLSSVPSELEEKELLFAKSKNDTQNSTVHQNRVANALRQAEEEIDNIAKREEKAIEKNKQAIPPLTRLEALYTIRNQEKKHEQAKNFTSRKSLRNSITALSCKTDEPLYKKQVLSEARVRSGNPLEELEPFNKQMQKITKPSLIQGDVKEDAMDRKTSFCEGSIRRGLKKKRTVKKLSLPIFDELFLYSDNDKQNSNNFGKSAPYSNQSNYTWIFSKFGDENLCTDRKHSFFGEASLLSKKLTAKEQKQIFQQKADPLLKIKSKHADVDVDADADTNLSWEIPDTDYNNLFSSKQKNEVYSKVSSPYNPRLSSFAADVYSIASTVPLSLLSQLSVHSKANKKNSETAKFHVGTVNTTGTTFLTSPTLIKPPQNISGSLNRVYFYNSLSQNKACQAATAKIKDTPLESPVSHRVWQPKRMEPSTFRMYPRNKSTLVVPRISQKDWKNIMEWQLKKHFFEEDKRLLPLYSVAEETAQASKGEAMHLPKDRKKLRGFQNQNWSKNEVVSFAEKGRTTLQSEASSKLCMQTFVQIFGLPKGLAKLRMQSFLQACPLPVTKNTSQPFKEKLSLQNKRLKIKRVHLYLPWVSIKKGIDTANDQSILNPSPKTKRLEWPLTRLDLIEKEIKSSNFIGVVDQDSAVRLNSLLSPVTKAKQLVNALRLPKNSEVSTFSNEIQSSSCGDNPEFGYRIANYWRLPIQQNFLSSKSRNCTTQLRSRTREGIQSKSSSNSFVHRPKYSLQRADKIFTAHESILFESVTKYSWLFMYTLFFGLMFKQLLKFIYKVGLKNFFIKFLHSDFGRTITSEEFRDSVQNPPLSEIYTPKKRLAELVGLGKNKAQLLEIVWFLRNNCQGRHGPRGILLVGVPGVENISVVQAIAGEANVPIIIQSLEKIAADNEPQRQLEQLYTRAQKQAPCILFLDQLDTIGARRDQLFTDTKRGHALNSSISSQFTNDEQMHTKERGNKLNIVLRLLTILDGITQSSGVVTVATARNLTNLDPALLRPKRFDRKIYLSLPNQQDRVQLFKIQTQSIGHIQEMPWNYLSLRTESMSAADIKSAINYSLFRAVQQNSVHTVETLEYGIDCVKTLTDKRLQKTK